MPRRSPALPRYPKLAEAFYIRQVVRWLRPLDDLIRKHVLPVINAYRSPDELRGDVWRADDELDQVRDDLVIALGRVRTEWSRTINLEQFEKLVRAAAKRVDKHNATEQARTMRGVAVVDVFKSESYLAAELPGWIEQNTSLIVRGGIVRGRIVQPLWESAIDRVGELAGEGFKAGTRHEVIAKQIRGELGVGRARSVLIARDQTNKLNGQLTRARQKSVGFTHYRWSTAQDRRVRQEHADQHGRIFAWNDPPPTGHPGEEIQCRCIAIPHQAGGPAQAKPVDVTKAAERQAERQAASSTATAAESVGKSQAEARDLFTEARQHWNDANGIARNLGEIERRAAPGQGWPATHKPHELLTRQANATAGAALNAANAAQAVQDLANAIATLPATEAGALQALEGIAQLRGTMNGLRPLIGLAQDQLELLELQAAVIEAKLANAPSLVRNGYVRIVDGKLKDHAHSMRAMRQIPKHLRDRVKARGARQDFVLGDVTKHPQMGDLKGVQPRGWSAGKTWEDVDGVYSPSKRLAVTASDGRAPGKYSTVAGHEYGHAVDANFHQFGADLSETARFRQVYLETITTEAFDKMRPGLKSYLTQPGNAGPSEMFAEMFGRFYADGTAGRTGWRKDFPALSKYFRAMERAAKAGDVRFDRGGELRTDAAAWCCPEAEAIHRKLVAMGYTLRTPRGPDGLIGDVALDGEQLEG